MDRGGMSEVVPPDPGCSQGVGWVLRVVPLTLVLMVVDGLDLIAHLNLVVTLVEEGVGRLSPLTLVITVVERVG